MLRDVRANKMSIKKTVHKKFSKFNWLKSKIPLNQRNHINAEYYQKLHERQNSKYSENNWLIGQEQFILSCNPSSLIELGFGNAQFLRKVSNDVNQVVGIDWAISPHAKNLPKNVSLKKADIMEIDLPETDLLCSADVLEHFDTKQLETLLPKLVKKSQFNFHIIACYDDGHSHLSVLNPNVWLSKFSHQSKDFYLKEVSLRNGKKNKEVCVITNIPR